MSQEIENKVVQFQFKNDQFEKAVAISLVTLDKLKSALNFDGAKESLERIGKTFSRGLIDTASVEENVEYLAGRFEWFERTAVRYIDMITDSVVNMGRKMVSAVTVDPVVSGLQEYETQINAIQTIMSNTASKGTTIDEVNDALDELNHYADMTIYNFTEMTRNIGTFTAAGVDLDSATSAIKGIANLAAASGSSSNQASVAMYQLSQALASGVVNLQDWNSVVNAGMGGQLFQDALKETGREMGAVIDESLSFRDSISSKDGSKWLTSDILLETLKKFADDESMIEAATKVKTFTQLIDTLKEAMQSGWTQSWEYILGDFYEARELWTMVSDAISSVINASANARNAILKDWKALGGRTYLIEAFVNLTKVLVSIVKPIKKAFDELFPATTGARLAYITESLSKFIAYLILSESAGRTITNILVILGTPLKIALHLLEQLATLVPLIISIVYRAVDAFLALISPITYLGKLMFKTTSQVTIFDDAIGLLRAGLYLILNTFTGVTAMISNFVTALGQLKVIKPITDYIDSMNGKTSLMTKIMNTVMYPIRSLTNLIYSLSLRINEMLTNFDFSPMVKGIDNITDAIGRLLIKAVDYFTKIGTNLMKTVKPFADVMYDIVVDIGSNFINLVNTLVNSFSKFGDIIKDAFVSKDASSAIGDISESFKSVGESIQTIPDKLKELVEWLKQFDFVSGIFDKFSSIGDTVLQAMRDMETTLSSLTFADFGNAVVTGFQWIVDGVVALKDLVVDAITGLKNAFTGAKDVISGETEIMNVNVASAMDNMSEHISKAAESTKGFRESFGEKTSAVWEKLVSIAEKTQPIFSKLGEIIGSLLNSFTQVIATFAEGADVDQIMQIFSEGVFGYAIGQIKEMVTNMFGLGDLMEPITDFFDGLSDTVEAVNEDIQSGSFIKIALAIGILAGSLMMMGKVNYENLLGITAALAALSAGVLGMMKAVDNFAASANIKSMPIVVGAILALSIAMSFIAKAMNEVGKIGDTEIIVNTMMSLLPIMLAFANMIKSASFLTGNLGQMIGVALTLIMMAEAVKILADAMMKLKNMKPETLMVATFAIVSVIVALAGAIKLLDKTNVLASMIGMSIGLLAIANAMLILTPAVIALSLMDPDKLANGFLVISGLLAELVIVMVLFSELKTSAVVESALALMIVAQSLVVLTGVILGLGLIDAGVLIQGFQALGIALAMLSVMMFAFDGKDASKTAAAMIALSASLIILFGALMLYAGIKDWGGMAKAGVALLGLTAAIVIISKFGSGIQKGAASIIVLSVAMGIMGRVINYFGQLDWETVLKGLAMMAISILGFAAAALALQFALPILTSMSASFLALGAGAWLLTKALVQLALMAPILTTAFNVILEAIDSMLESLAETLPNIVDNILIICEEIIRLLITDENSVAKQLWNALIDLLHFLLKSITDEAPQILAELVELIISVAGGLATAISDREEDLTQAIADLLDELLRFFIIACFKLGENISEDAAEIWDNFGEAITNAWESTKKAVDKFFLNVRTAIDNAKKGIKDKFEKMGGHVLEGLTDGLAAGIDAIKTWIVDHALKIKDWFCEALGISSPSKVMRDEVGRWIMPGVTEGIDKYDGDIENKIDGIGATMVEGFRTAIDQINKVTEELDDPQMYINPVLNLDNVSRGVKDINGIMARTTTEMAGINSNLSINGVNSLNMAIDKMNTFNEKNNAETIDAINALKDEVGYLQTAMMNMQIVLDGKAVVGGIAPQMDAALGNIYNSKRRGV